MKSILLFFVPFLFLGTTVFSQSNEPSEGLYTPLEFKRAYEKGTRSRDGRVPENYWQNSAQYQIEAIIDPSTKLLEGKAEITYYNNSPDTLSTLSFHSYHDYLKPYASRENYDGLEIPYKGFEIENLVVAQERIDLNDPNKVRYGGTNYTVQLSEPLPPKDSLNLSIEWNYNIPEDTQRTGAIDSTSMFVGYWYPEMAVRDDIFGWDRKAFDGATEFYHDFSDYKVSITLPGNFTVWASVPPDNPEEVYSEEVRSRLAQARESSSPVCILSQKNLRRSSEGSKTWKFSAKNFPDFAFALSDHYVWEAATYSDAEGEFFIQTAYPYTTPGFSQILPTLATSLEVFHQRFPKYPFPYDHFTIFNGQEGGGMEFPGMANNGYTTKEDYKRWLNLDINEEQALRANLDLTLHEMVHSYLPFMMGINEKKFAWMDEGFAEASKLFLEAWRPRLDLDFSSLGSLAAVPMMVPSDDYDKSYINAYQVSGAAYRSLYHLLGEAQFFKALHSFMDEWKYKHPTPYDLMYTFNREADMDLLWFFNNWFFDWGYADLGIVSVDDKGITIRNNGGRAISFQIKITFDDEGDQTVQMSPEVWKDTSTYLYKVPEDKTVTKVELLLPVMGDADTENNFWEKDAVPDR